MAKYGWSGAAWTQEVFSKTIKVSRKYSIFDNVYEEIDLFQNLLKICSNFGENLAKNFKKLEVSVCRGLVEIPREANKLKKDLSE